MGTYPIRRCQSQYIVSLAISSEVARMMVTKFKDQSEDSITLLVFLNSSFFTTSAFSGRKVDCLATRKIKIILFPKSESEIVSSAFVPSKTV